jgi:signal transduction histidine kinase
LIGVGDTSTLGLTVVSMVIALVGAALGVHYRRLLKIADEQSRRAEAANRVKDEFLATLSHELRTPLNSVLGWARLLATSKLDSAQTARAVQAIEQAGWAQARLIEDLLDLSRILSGKLQIHLAPTALQPLVDAAVDSLRPAAAAKQITLTVILDRTLGFLEADPDRVQQILWNLVSNAIKFTPSGGHVDVRLSATSDEAVISVEDTGIGFGRHLAAHLFERFHQGDSTSTRAYSGLGVGLGIVRHLAELHGGTVTASSHGEGAGSLFEVRLPIVAAAAPAIRERRHIERRRGRNFTVPHEAWQYGGS